MDDKQGFSIAVPPGSGRVMQGRYSPGSGNTSGPIRRHADKALACHAMYSCAERVSVNTHMSVISAGGSGDPGRGSQSTSDFQGK